MFLSGGCKLPGATPVAGQVSLLQQYRQLCSVLLRKLLPRHYTYIYITLVIWPDSGVFPQNISYFYHNREFIDSQGNTQKWEGAFRSACILYISTYHYAPSNDSPHIFHLLCYPTVSGILDVPIRKEQPYVQGDGQEGQWVQGQSDEARTFSRAHGVLLASPSSVDLEVPPKTVQRTEAIFPLKMVGRFWVWDLWRQADNTNTGWKRLLSTVKTTWLIHGIYGKQSLFYWAL